LRKAGTQLEARAFVLLQAVDEKNALEYIFYVSR